MYQKNYIKMALFGNKKRGSSQGSSEQDMPKLPKLPDSGETEDSSQEGLPKLPKYPSTEIGDKMSQSSIKEAVSGEKEDDEESADEFVHEQMTPEPDDLEYDENIEPEEKAQSRRVSPGTSRRRLTSSSGSAQKRTRDSGAKKKHTQKSKEESQENKPVFIRIDKYEESLETFEDAKKKISEMENLLSEIKDTKDKEEKELADWEKEVKELKNQVGKIEDDVFSKA